MAIHPSQCSLESIVDKSSSWGAIWLRPSAKTHSTKLRVSVHGLVIQMFCSQVSTQLSFPPTRVVLTSPLITRRCNHCVGFAICLIRPAPLRIAMARPAVASSLISRLRLSTPSPDLFALTPTPCCCKITPRSRIIETQPIPAAAALTAAWNSASALERLTTACVVDVDFRRCLPYNIFQELVLFLLCRHPAKFEAL